MNPDSNTPQETPSPSQPNSEPGHSKQNKILWIATGVFIVFMLVILIMAFVNKSDNNSTKDTPNNSNTSGQSQDDEQADTVALSTLDTAALLPPAELPGYTLNTKNETQYQYVKDLGTATACRFNFGTATADAQPGDSSRAIVENVVASQAGGQLVGKVTQESELRVKSSDGKTTYTLPTFSASIKFSQDGQEAVTHLLIGVAILQSGERSVINISCVDKKDLATARELAQTITVK